MKKAGKTTRPSRYVLNQIPYDYTVEVWINKYMNYNYKLCEHIINFFTNLL